jgi:hypothetical protein
MAIFTTCLGVGFAGAGYKLVALEKSYNAKMEVAAGLCAKHGMDHHRINRVDVCIDRGGRMHFLEALEKAS